MVHLRANGKMNTKPTLPPKRCVETVAPGMSAKATAHVHTTSTLRARIAAAHGMSNTAAPAMTPNTSMTIPATRFNG